MDGERSVLERLRAYDDQGLLRVGKDVHNLRQKLRLVLLTDVLLLQDLG